VFTAAKELFSRFGFKKTTVDEIADWAGISKRTMYEVFHSKEDILAELVMFEALTFRHHCKKQIKNMDNMVDELRTFCFLWRDYFNANKFLAQVLNDEMGMFSPFLKDEIDLVETGMKEMISKLLTEGMSKGAFRPLDLPSTVDCVLTLLHKYTIEAAEPQNLSGDTEWINFIIHAVKA
jgi:AcrR family transcriptional regulator